jgi:hypothetical protein
MAYVKLTDSILGDIRLQITNKANKELATVPMPMIPLTAEQIENVERYIWADYYPLRSQMPPHWMTQHQDELRVRFDRPNLGQEGGSAPSLLNTVLTTVLTTVVTLVFPPDQGRNNHGTRLGQAYRDSPDSHYLFHSSIYGGWTDDAVAELFEKQDLHWSVKNRWIKVQNEVIGFLKEAKSINEAVKLWPAVTAYLPEGVLEKIQKKSDRSETMSRAAEMLAKMDTDAAIMSAVAAEMS